MDLHLYRNAQDRWHDLRNASREHEAVLGLNRLTLAELIDRLTPEVQVATIGQQLALIRNAVHCNAGTRYAFEAIRDLKSAGVRSRESEIVQRYETALRKSGLIDRHDRCRLAASRVAERRLPWLQRFERVVLHTIYDPTEAEFTLIRNLIEALPDGGAVILFNNTANVKPTQFAEWTWQRFIKDDSLADRTFPEFCRPSSPNSGLIEKLFVFDTNAEKLEPLHSLRIIQTSGRYREVEIIGSEIAGLLTSGASAHDIAVVVRHIENYGEMIEDVFARFEIPHRFETGVPLLRIPIIKYWFALLELVTGDRSRDDLARVLASAYFEPRLSPAVDVEKELAAFGYMDRHHLPASDLARRRNSPLTTEVHRLESWMDRLESSTSSAAEFIVEFRPPQNLTNRDCEAWRALYDELLSIDALAGKMPFAEFRAIALDIAATCTVDRLSADAATRGAARVQIIHPNSLGYRSYKWIFAPGMVDGEFPAAAWANPLLAEEMLENLNKGIWPRRVLTPRDQNRREPLYLFMVLDSACEKTTLTFPNATIDGEPIVPSIYIGETARHFASDIIERMDPGLPVHDRGECLRRIAQAWRDGSIDDQGARELLGNDIIKRVSVERRGPDRAHLGRDTLHANHTWHPSELNALAACPFVFLARHRLGLRTDDLPDFEVAPTEIGKLAHEILRVFYATPIPASENAAAERMRAIIEQRLANADVSGQGTYAIFDPSLWRIRRKQLVAALEQYVRFAVMDARSGYQTLFEYLDNPLPRAQLGSISLGGRPDHVAVRRIGSRVEGIRIDDFKYSAASTGTSKLLKDSFQIPIYAHLAAQTLNADESTQIEGRYLLLRSPSTPVISHGIDGPLLEDVRNRIDVLVSKACQGNLRPDPTDRQDCVDCSYRRLCRFYGT
jgi:hypothetical protein